MLPWLFWVFMALHMLDTSLVQLVVGPFYLLFTVSFLLLQSSRRALFLPQGTRVSTDHILVYSYYHLFVLSSPVLLLFFLLLSSYRGYEGFFFLAQLYVTAWHIRWFFFSLLVFALANVCFSWSLTRSTLPYLGEVVLGLYWLFWCFNWALCVTNLVIFIFFLEILGLALLVVFLYLFVTARHVGLAQLNHKTFNTIYAAKFFFIQAFLFFLWSSVISMLLLFWSSLYLALSICTLDVASVELFYDFSFAYHGTVVSGRWFTFMGFLFFFALLLKTAVLPLQFWLISFYKHLPLSLLFTYFGFYYIYFVVIILNLFFGYLYAFAPLWYWYSLGAFGLTVVYAAFNLLEATTLRGFFAYSSVINLFMLFIFMLSMFDGTFVISGL